MKKARPILLNAELKFAARAYKILTEEVIFPPQDIIFDPNVFAIATGIEEHNNYAVDFIETIKWIKANLPYAKVSGGISNFHFHFGEMILFVKRFIPYFLYYAIKAGLDMGIVNPGMLQVYDEIPKDLLELVEDVVLNRRHDATERLVEFAEKIKSGASKLKILKNGVNEPLEERLKHSLS